ncbi:hypothetical protein TanjilG_03986 [Lupinus angustifolius]|uniref:Myb-like domain-containing protein n=1 Tax=Lupinus angustifolius TaxID=3871 RepID=A0A4P1RAT8_LUPAN|nr:hypothetical protein TanjilG_03986 [Lupinus angustifolius]
MLGDSSEGGGGGEVAAVVVGGGGGSTSGDEERRMEESDRSSSFGGNRWPRQETLALLRIRSDMDVAFRDASVKAPLWEQVSRKLAELGYKRSAKKCKEKFENVYKYHKRTKDGRSGKSEGKTYRFFDQLQALEHHHPPTIHSSYTPQSSLAPPPISSSIVATATTTVPMPMPPVANTTLGSVSVPHVSIPQGIVTSTPSINLINVPSYQPTNPTNFPPPLTNPTTSATIPISFPNIPNDLLSNSSISSSSTSSDEILDGRRKRKRKWEDFFNRLMKNVMEKQVEQQRTFLEAIEKREHERMVREEAWRVQEIQRINKEREILAQERSTAAAKDAAVMAFLQKLAEKQNFGQALNNNISIPPQPQQQQSQLQPQVVAQPIAPPAPTIAPTLVQPQIQLIVQPGPPLQPVVPPPPPPQQQVTNTEIVRVDNNGENMIGASSSRWPKVEIEALIKLRTELDMKYQENTPKGPLWEEISSSMRKLGYNRNAKRCKEKWENINKYFKKVKESNKKRSEDSKTCPYYQQLEALYKEKNKMVQPESMVAPLMVQPEQQWPPQQQREEDHDDFDDEEKNVEEKEKESEGCKNEVVANKAASERMVREEAWRVQEIQRINKEREILAQERSTAAAKDAAVMAFLQKLAEKQNFGQALNNNISIPPQPQQQQSQLQPQVVAQPIAPPAPTIAPTLVQPQIQLIVQPGPPLQPVVPPPPPPQQQVTNTEIVRVDNNGENMIGASSSRWPKVEIEALIKLRTELDMKYQENTPKGPLWEEISSSMRKLGYNRNAKRCKEKWENINKYFKKVKESNKKRSEDSKTCPYYQQLEALYKEKNKMVQPESMVAPLMVQPEQQWPPQQQREEDHDDFDDEEKNVEEKEKESEGCKNEVVANKAASGE